MVFMLLVISLVSSYIFRNKELPVRKRSIPLRIPLGTFRIVDLIKE